jgi:hypothetical protein
MLTMDKVLDRAAKFLAMRENRGASETEAAAAAEHLQRLLQEHNLTLSQVELHQDGGNTPVAKRVKEQLTAGLSRSRRWQMTLLEGIAKNNFCIAVMQTRRTDSGKRAGQVSLVGREVNVASTKMTYDYIATVLLRAQKEYEATLPGLAEMTSNDKREKYWFFMDGAVSRIIERLNEQRAQREAEDAARAAPSVNGTGRELVLSDVYGSEIDLNNDHLNGYPPGTTATRRRENEARVARQEAELERLVKEEGVTWIIAWYRSHGYDEHAAVEAAAEYEKQNRRAGRHRHSAQNWSRRDESHYRKVASGAYKAGRVKGEEVGLDSQVGANTTKKLR